MNPYLPLKLENISKVAPKMFFGNPEDLAKIVQGVTASGQDGQSFSLVGGPKMGKTRLLFQIAQQLRAIDTRLSAEGSGQIILPMYLNMLQFQSTSEVFFAQVAHLLHISLESHLPAIQLPLEARDSLRLTESAPEPYEKLVETLRLLHRAVAPARLRVVLLMDDLWHMENSEITMLAQKLRGLFYTEFTEQIVTYVISGSFQKLTNALGSPLENILRYRYLHVLDTEASLAMINEPTGYKLPMEVVQYVYQETGGHPFLLQYIMSVLCEHEDWTGLTEEDVIQATKRFHSDIGGFERLWGERSEIDWLIYDILCQIEPATIDELTSRLKISSSGKRLNIKKPAVRDSLHVLSTIGVIREVKDEEDNQTNISYAVAGQWPKRWFQQWKPRQRKLR